MSKHARSAAVLPVDGVERATAEERTFPALNPATGEVLWQVPDAGRRGRRTAAAAAARRACTRPVEHRHGAARRRAPAAPGRARATGPTTSRCSWPPRPACRSRSAPTTSTPRSPSMRVAAPRPGGRRRRPWSPRPPRPSPSRSRRSAAMLVAGGTVVLKPAPEAASAALELGRIALDILPRGVLNVVTTRDVDVAIALTLDPRVDEVSFTGSSVAGERVLVAGEARRQGRTRRRRRPEPGPGRRRRRPRRASSSAAAVAVAANAGQGVPAARRRVVVPAHRYDEALARRGRGDGGRSVVGDPTDPGTLCGPLRSTGRPGPGPALPRPRPRRGRHTSRSAATPSTGPAGGSRRPSSAG